MPVAMATEGPTSVKEVLKAWVAQGSPWVVKEEDFRLASRPEGTHQGAPEPRLHIISGDPSGREGPGTEEI